MPKFLVKVSYVQWCSVEVEAKDEDEAVDLIDDMDLDDYKDTDITDFTIDDVKEIK